MEELRTMDLPPHEFDHYTMQQIGPLSTTTDSEVLVTLLEIYSDVFIAMRNNTSHTHLLQISRAILHGVYAIFPTPAVTGHNGFDQVALSKLDTGEVTWEHVKGILGWIKDGLNGTMQLPMKNARTSVS